MNETTVPARPALGIDLGGTKIEAVVLDSAGHPLWQRRIATPGDGYDATLQALAQLAADAQLACGPCSVGIGTPGTLAQAGLMKNSNSLCLNGRPLLARLAHAAGSAAAYRQRRQLPGAVRSH